MLVHPWAFKACGARWKAGAVGSIPSHLRQFTPSRRGFARLGRVRRKEKCPILRMQGSLRHSLKFV